MKIVLMNRKDISLLNNQIKRDYFLLILMIFSFFLVWTLFKSNDIIGNLVLILGSIAILISFLIRIDIYKDLASKKNIQEN